MVKMYCKTTAKACKNVCRRTLLINGKDIANISVTTMLAEYVQRTTYQGVVIFAPEIQNNSISCLD